MTAVTVCVYKDCIRVCKHDVESSYSDEHSSFGENSECWRLLDLWEQISSWYLHLVKVLWLLLRAPYYFQGCILFIIFSVPLTILLLKALTVCVLCNTWLAIYHVDAFSCAYCMWHLIHQVWVHNCEIHHAMANGSSYQFPALSYRLLL